MMRDPFPPELIDGARVVEWAWSGSEPFGIVPGADPVEIHGLAIATYDDRAYYRFACDAHWECVQDADFGSVRDAKERLPEQYRNVVATWHRVEPSSR